MRGRSLTEAVRRRPYSVVLLDEVEKAHPEVFDILLQVLDDGRLTDGQGRTVDFRNVILIMTTNAGAESLSRPSLGFTAKRERGDEMQAINKLFTPEFRNRLDAIIPFGALVPNPSSPKSWTNSCSSSNTSSSTKKSKPNLRRHCANIWQKKVSIHKWVRAR